MQGKKKSGLSKIALLLLVLALLLIGYRIKNGAGQRKQDAYSADLFAMDTYMTFTAYGSHGEEAVADIKEEIMGLERLWSVTDESSEIYRVNHSAGQWTDVSAETAELITFSLEMAEKTEGALDPTIYPVLTAWGFTTGENKVPSEEEIKGLLKVVDYKKVKIDGSRIALENGMMLDLGAVGKGYAGDLAVGILKEHGISSALLDIGGNIQAVGSKPDGSHWRVGIRNPFGEGSFGVLEISDMAVVTSGCYERYFIGEDGIQYGHIMNPDTGYPVKNGFMSVTVVAREGKLCDALSTALFVMGLERGTDYWRENPGFEMILVTEDGTLYLTEGIREQFILDNAWGTIEVRVISRDKEDTGAY